MTRITVPLPEAVLNQLDEQVRRDATNKAAFCSNLIELILTSEGGKILREAAARKDTPLLAILSDYLSLMANVPTEEIEQLGLDSQRHLDQMLVYLLLVGLKVYKKRLEREELD
jgi:Arc/MetJ-type ribon-helix-helix transcriptional regulator